MEIRYDGSYPNLCSGQLIVIIDKKEWVFPSYCMSSGGGVSFDSDWCENVTSGEWSISEWPDNFPEDLKEDVLCAVNSEISQGCCGGCV
jgi:hypothetical protein